MIAMYSDYMQCAKWSSIDEDGESLEPFQFSDKAEKKMKEDLDSFIEYCETNISERMFFEYQNLQEPEQFAHDFWLTRNGHGAGFWDRGLGEIGDILTKAAKTFGECNLYLNDETQEIEVY
jgi:hypothetical protein